MKKLLSLTLLALSLGLTAQAQTNIGTMTVTNALTWDHGGEPTLAGFRIYVAPVGVTNTAEFVRVDGLPRPGEEKPPLGNTVTVTENVWMGDGTQQLDGPWWLYATAVATNLVLTYEAGQDSPYKLETKTRESDPSEIVEVTFRAGVPVPPGNFQLYSVVTAAATNALPPLPLN